MGIIRKRITGCLIACMPLACVATAGALTLADETVTAGASSAAPSTTRPAPGQLHSVGNGLGRRELGAGNAGAAGGGGGGGAAAFGLHRSETFTPEETQAAVMFFSENSPNRMKYFKMVPETAPVHRVLTQGLVRTYRPILNFKDKSPELYGLLIQQIKLRDDAFQLAMQLDNGQKDADSKLRELVTQIVDVSLKARSLRLDLLQKELSAQQTKLASDEADPSALIEPETTTIKTDEQRLVRRLERMQGQRGQTMLDADPQEDPLAAVGPDMVQP